SPAAASALSASARRDLSSSLEVESAVAADRDVLVMVRDVQGCGGVLAGSGAVRTKAMMLSRKMVMKPTVSRASRRMSEVMRRMAQGGKGGIISGGCGLGSRGSAPR